MQPLHRQMLRVLVLLLVSVALLPYVSYAHSVEREYLSIRSEGLWKFRLLSGFCNNDQNVTKARRRRAELSR